MLFLGLQPPVSGNQKSKGSKGTCEHSAKSCSSQGDSEMSVHLALLKAKEGLGGEEKKCDHITFSSEHPKAGI